MKCAFLVSGLILGCVLTVFGATPPTSSTLSQVSTPWRDSVLAANPYGEARPTGDIILNLAQWSAADGGNDHWYAVIALARPWKTQDSIAKTLPHEGEFGYLASVTSAAENQFIIGQIIAGVIPPTIVDEFYLGGLAQAGDFQWTTGEPLIYQNWDYGEPNGDGAAMAMWGSSNYGKAGTWNDVPADTAGVESFHQLWSVIEWGPVDVTPPTDSPYIKLTQWRAEDGGNGHWYAILDDVINYQQASVKAYTLMHDDHHGYLATVVSAEENAFIYNNLLVGTHQPSYSDQFYLGGTWSSSVWSWNSGEPWIYQNWSNGEPNNVGVETAMAMWGPNNIGDARRIPGKWNNTMYTDASGWYHRAWSVIEWGGFEPPEPPDPDPMILHLTQWTAAAGGNDHWYAVIAKAGPGRVHDSLAKTLDHDGEMGYLATIGSASENAFIVNHVINDVVPNAIVDEFYLGGRLVDGAYKWSTNEPMIYRNWDEGEPAGDGDCMAMWGVSTYSRVGRWNDVPWDTAGHGAIHQLWSIVEWGPTDSNPPVDSPFIKLTEWRTEDGGNGHWYALVPKVISFEQHLANAPTLLHDGQPAHLATITTPEENDFVYTNLLIGTQAPSHDDQYYLGGTWEAGTWRWLTNEPWMYTNWSNGEPNNVGIETGMAMWGANNIGDPRRVPGKWNNTMYTDATGWYHRDWAIVEWGAPEPSIGPYPTNEWISVFCPNPVMDGHPINPGAVIRAFDPQGVVCGMAATRNDGSLGFMLIYRDDPYTDFDEGAQPGDPITFKVGVTSVVTSPSIVWTANGAQSQVCSFNTGSCQQIALHEGWNLVSWNVRYAGNVRDLIAPIRPAVGVIMTYDNGGLIYDPQLEQYSTLIHVDYRHGYWIKMSSNAVLAVCGDPVAMPEIISLNAGWNLISYWPTNEQTPQSALATIADKLQVAIGFENGGKTYLPDNPGFSTLDAMKPGFGYWVRLSGPDVLDYFFMPTSFAGLNPPAHSVAVDGGGARFWMSLYGDHITLDGRRLTEGAHIQVCTESGVCIGGSTYAGGVLKFMPIYGADEIDPSTSAFPHEGDRVHILVDGKQVEPALVWSGHGTTARLTGLRSSALPTAFALAQNYPNPFNPSTKIGFALPTASDYSLVIYNVTGQKVAEFTGAAEAGSVEVEWNASGNASGIYFYKLTAGSFSATKKMMLLK